MQVIFSIFSHTNNPCSQCVIRFSEHLGRGEVPSLSLDRFISHSVKKHKPGGADNRLKTGASPDMEDTDQQQRLGCRGLVSFW